MELSYLIAAIRRRWWLVGLLSLLGAVGGYLAGGSPVVAYEARAVLNIQPPQNALGGTVFFNDPDRYVIGQLSVLQNSGLASQVAEQFPGETMQSISRAVAVTHEPRTDLVTVAVTRADAKQAIFRL